MRDLVGRRRFRVTESISSWSLGKILGIPVYFQMVKLTWKICFTVRCLNVEEPVLRESKSIVFSTSSSSLRPCAIRAVDAIVSVSEGWSNHDTLSVTSPSPRSMRDALAARRDLAGLSLNKPFDEVTAWRNNWYCAEDTFLLDPSSSSSSERDLSYTLSHEYRVVRYRYSRLLFTSEDRLCANLRVQEQSMNITSQWQCPTFAWRHRSSVVTSQY